MLQNGPTLQPFLQPNWRQPRRSLVRHLRSGAGWVAWQPVGAGRVLAGGIGLGTQHRSCAPPDVGPLFRWHGRGRRDDHAPSWRIRPVRPRSVADPAHAGQALRVGWDTVRSKTSALTDWTPAWSGWSAPRRTASETSNWRDACRRGSQSG